MAALKAAEPIPLTDTTIIPGERVGPITKDMTLDELKARIGGREKFNDQDGRGDIFLKPAIPFVGTTVFKGTDRELIVVAEQDSGKILQTVLVGSAWTPPFDLKKGMTVDEVEKANGKPFKVFSFDWGSGGEADLYKGKLDGKVMIRFSIPGAPSEALGRRRWLPSDGALRGTEVKVSEIGVILSQPKTPDARDEKDEIRLD